MANKTVLTDKQIMEVADAVHQSGWNMDGAPDGMLIDFARGIIAKLGQPAASESGAVPFDMIAHLARQRAWSERTFGPGSRAKGVVDHIRKELCEIEADPADLKEWVDVVILALDGAWRSGATPAQIVDAIVAKQTKNEGRQWPDWRAMDPDKAIEHDRSVDAAPAAQPEKQAGRDGAVDFDHIAGMLESYAAALREYAGSDLERWHYIPEIEEQAQALRAAATPAPSQQAAPPSADLSQAARDVLAERRHQVDIGYDAEHDDEHVCNEISAVAAFYVMPPAVRDWPATETGYGKTFGEAIVPGDWHADGTQQRRHQLVMGAAMAIAEIERLDRAALAAAKPEGEQR